MNKKLKILFFCMIFVGGALSAQEQPLKKSRLLLSLQQKIFTWKPLVFEKSIYDAVKTRPFLPPDFYSHRLGFFCKQEIKFEKITKIPFRFRLGSAEQCDWLEGKKR